MNGFWPSIWIAMATNAAQTTTSENFGRLEHISAKVPPVISPTCTKYSPGNTKILSKVPAARSQCQDELPLNRTVAVPSCSAISFRCLTHAVRPANGSRGDLLNIRFHKLNILRSPVELRRTERSDNR